MDYNKVYSKLIERAKDRKLQGYKEKHHIVPKSLGGSNKKENIVELTAREHYLCHWLLTRMYPNNNKLAYAFWFMSHQTGQQYQNRDYKVTSRMYEEAVSNLKMTKEHKEKIASQRRGKKTLIHPVTGKFKYVNLNELQQYLDEGWVNTNGSKGKIKNLTKEGRKKLKEARIKYQKGKVGTEAQASKGPYTVEYEDGTKITKGSYPELSKTTGIPYATLRLRGAEKENIMYKGFKVYKGI